jgi:hypothetical protein
MRSETEELKRALVRARKDSPLVSIRGTQDCLRNLLGSPGYFGLTTSDVAKGNKALSLLSQFREALEREGD